MGKNKINRKIVDLTKNDFETKLCFGIEL